MTFQNESEDELLETEQSEPISDDENDDHDSDENDPNWKDIQWIVWKFAFIPNFREKFAARKSEKADNQKLTRV